MTRKTSSVYALSIAFLSTLILLSATAFGQSFNIAPGGFTASNVCASNNAAEGCQVLTNGSPTLPQVLANGTLRLNAANQNQHASAWYYTAQPLSTGFTTAFQFQITSTGACQGCSSPADGIALVIQGDPAGTGALGYTGNGQNISYGNNDNSEASGPDSAIVNSLAVELDTFFNPDYSDPDGNHIAVQSCGPNTPSSMLPNSSDHGYMCASATPAKIALQSLPQGLSLSDGHPHTITVNYNPPANGCVSGCNNFSVYFDSTLILQTTIDLTKQLSLVSTASNNPNTPATGAYIGFTAATGGSVENNDILSWSFSQLPLAPITIPEPLQTTQTQFNYSPILTATVDYSQSGLPASSFNGVVMQGTSQGITDSAFANLVNNTPFQGSTCLHQDLGGGTFSCVVTTDLCTNPNSNTPLGANCPQTGTQALITVSNTFNADPTQKPYVNPAFIMGKDSALTNCQASDDNTCKGLQNIFVSISGDPSPVGRTKDFNSILIPIEGIVQPQTSASTTPALNQGWTNGNVNVTLNSTEVVPPININPPATLPTISSISYTISGVNAPTPVNGTITGSTGSFTVPGTVEGATTVTFQAMDSAGTNETITTTNNGQMSTSLPTLTINVDRTNPTFNCSVPTAAWQATDVNVPCTASDNAGGSGLATPASFTEMTSVPVGTETNAAFTTAVNVSDIAGNTVVAGPYGPFWVDKKAPVIAPPSLTSPPVFGQPDSINFSCSDGGSGVVLCGPQGSPTFAPVPNTGTLSTPANTSTAGPKSLVLYSQDLVNNITTPVTFNYNVAQAQPVLTWQQPAPITYGTPLSPLQLNATASVNGNPVGGSFSYTPGVGAILSPGVQTLKVTFTPSDMTDYASASTSVQITVLQPALTFNPSSINFGNIYLGLPAVGAIQVINPGTVAVQISSVKLVPGTADKDDYGILSACPKTLKAGGTCVIGVGFIADDLGLRTAAIVVTSSASTTPQQIPLSANVIKKVSKSQS